MFARGLVPWAYEVRIAVAASAVAAMRREDALAGLREIEKLLARIGVKDDRADWNFQHQIFGGFSVAVRAFAMSAASGFEFAIVTIAQQRIVVRIGFDVDVAT